MVLNTATFHSTSFLPLESYQRQARMYMLPMQLTVLVQITMIFPIIV